MTTVPTDPGSEYFLDLEVEGMDGPAESPDLNPTQPLWDQPGRVVHARVTDTTTLVDLQQLLVEEWDAIPLLNVARLVSRTRRSV